MKINTESLRVTEGRSFKLEEHDPGDLQGSRNKKEAAELLKEDIKRLTGLQDQLYAQDRQAVLLIFQAMDAAGKDGTIKHVMSGVNPQGCIVHSFKQPSALELDHDYLWRCHLRAPGRGMIGIFNRSYYEDVLVARVHPQILQAGKLPADRIHDGIWKDRYRQIRDFERHLHENGTLVLKFFLNLSREEQRRRFLQRIDRPEKNWKFSSSDVQERQFWPRYMEAYEEAIRHTATAESPWYVVPADHKWFTRAAVARILIEHLEQLDLHYPKVGEEQLATLQQWREKLLAED